MMLSNNGSRATTRILIIESDPQVRSDLVLALSAEGHEVAEAADGLAGLRLLFSLHPDLVILALALPQMDGWTTLQRIREATDVPVLIISDKKGLGQRIRAFHQGAQDCLVQPIVVEEVVLRVAATIRRSVPPQEQNQVYDDGVLHVDSWKQEVTINGRPVPLARQELALLANLIRRPGQVVTYSELLATLPWIAGDGNEQALRSLVHRLRRRLQTEGAGIDYLITHRGLGLRLNVHAHAPNGRLAPEAGEGNALDGAGVLDEKRSPLVLGSVSRGVPQSETQV
jgi:two-component system KDP operon response regulator KdpE